MLLFPIALWAQENATTAALSAQWETDLTLDADESTSAYEHILEDCAELAVDPINLNTATQTELALLPFLSENDIRAILRFRYEYGGFHSRYELMLVPGLSRQYARLALPFVTVPDEEITTPKRRDRSQHQLLTEANRTVEQRAGYRNPSAERIAADSAYRGNPWHHKLRYQYNYGRTFRAGLTVEKDPGEAYRKGAPWIGDSFGYYVAYRKDRGHLRQLIAGNYRVALGCGLLINQQFSIGKSMLATQLLGRSASIAPLTSAEEYDFEHGVAAQLHLTTHWDLTAFASSRLIDGLTSATTLSTIYTDGYHRTEKEESHRHADRVSLGGLHTEWSNHWLRFGINALYTYFDKPYERRIYTYNHNVFRGRDLLQTSAEYSVLLRHFSAKGEVARSQNGALATIHLLRYTPADRWNLLLIARSLSRHYQQVYASTYCESSDLQAERGAYLQVVYNAAAHLDLTGSADYFHLTSKKYGIAAPSRGTEGQLRADMKWERWSASLRYRVKKKYATNNVSSQSATLQGYYRHTTDLILSYQACPWLQLKQQWEYRLYSRQFVGSARGVGMSQRVSVKQAGWPLAVHGLVEWFRTDDYNSRIYLSDLNLRYTFSSTMLYGRGLRYGLAASWRLSSRCTLEGKYTLLNYLDRATISSGLQAIEGSVQQDVRVQCLWKF
jgi:hypothetical protein